MKENILHQCLKKKNEPSEALRMGFLSINDLVAVEGQYHKNCRQNFFRKRSKSVEDQLILHVVRTLMKFPLWIKKEAEVYTLVEIHQIDEKEA